MKEKPIKEAVIPIIVDARGYYPVPQGKSIDDCTVFLGHHKTKDIICPVGSGKIKRRESVPAALFREVQEEAVGIRGYVLRGEFLQSLEGGISPEKLTEIEKELEKIGKSIKLDKGIERFFRAHLLERALAEAKSSFYQKNNDFLSLNPIDVDYYSLPGCKIKGSSFLVVAENPDNIIANHEFLSTKWINYKTLRKRDYLQYNDVYCGISDTTRKFSMDALESLEGLRSFELRNHIKIPYFPIGNYL